MPALLIKKSIFLVVSRNLIYEMLRSLNREQICLKWPGIERLLNPWFLQRAQEPLRHRLFGPAKDSLPPPGRLCRKGLQCMYLVTRVPLEATVTWMRVQHKQQGLYLLAAADDGQSSL